MIVVCGLPGSGKTSHAKQLQSCQSAIRLCPDEWMETLSLSIWDQQIREKIERLQWHFAEDLLRAGLTVIIEWGTWTQSERDALRLRARELGASVELHYLSAPFDILFERLQRRGRENPPVRREQLLHWTNAFQPPPGEEQILWDRFLNLGGDRITQNGQ